ncbi:MAG: thioredoxin family protein [Holosporaceae bacterium]|nr:thioredoxin family protein [Holosporaceae bacterium]
MKNIMLKIMFILINIIFLGSSIAESPINIDITTNYHQMNDETFHCELILSIPNGHKLPKAPDISVTNPKQPKFFKYDEKLDQVSKTVYRVNFTAAVDNPELELTVDCPICDDNICTIISKNIRIAFIKEKKHHNTNIFWILLLGFLGGLMLNIMPCVLPVIIMKLKSLTSRQTILGSIAGNYTSFAIFGACIVSLKIAGNTVGWGMHFQNPYFLETITLILFCLVLYSFDIIQFFPSIQLKDSKCSAFISSFVSSIIASLVAIPCTAPFLGTAAAFAIQGSIFDLCLTFFAIATGFSAPYFLLFFIKKDFFSGIYRFSNTFKKVINSGVLVTFVWVFWLLSNYLSKTAIALYILSFITSAILLKMRRSVVPVLVICLCCRVLIDFSAELPKVNNNIIAQIAVESTKNHVTIFNITADWCLTCKYNNHIFKSNEMVELLKNNHIKFIEADMTKKDDTLMQFIHKHGRVGIPFTVVYGPGAPNGITLDEILTLDKITNAIKKASL